jgi:hypothetical protein
MITKLKHSVFSIQRALIFAGLAFTSQAIASPDISAVLDGAYQSGEGALSTREEGFSLGHTELSLSGAIDDQFNGQLVLVVESHDGEVEVGLEEAFVEASGLPVGLSLRAGRFLSQVGYLNGRHTHEDAFSDRPAIYKALLGGHYFDDGLRLNMLLPTPFYWNVGTELFSGGRLVEGSGDDMIGVATASSKWGGDIGDSSWQLGLSYLKHNLTIDVEDEESGDADDDDHAGHTHSALYGGENTWIVDGVWKWAPKGNSQKLSVVASAEVFHVDGLNEHATSDEKHTGWYSSLVLGLGPQWRVGVRHGEAQLSQAHGDHFHDQELKETSLMASWSRSHFSTVRLQYNRQSGEGFEEIDDSINLQYVMSLGAHGAHDF